MSNKKKRGKILRTKVPDANFIRFSEVQKKYLNEVRTRQVKEFNEAIEAVYEELGIIGKLEQAPPGTYKLRTSDLSGLDVLPPPPAQKETDPLTDLSKDIQPPGESEKDH